MKVVFFGNPQFALPTLEAVFNSNHDICCVVTGPDRKAGRSQKLQSSAVKHAAELCGLPILQPEHLNSPELIANLEELNPDIGVVVAYRILPPEIFNIPEKGCVNLHPSMLPDLRGAAPINWAIIRGYKTSGISTFLIKEKVDSGSILLQEKVEIYPDDNAGVLSDRLAVHGGSLIVESLNKMEAGELIPTPQSGKISRAPKLSDETRRILWNNSAENIHNLIRGLSPVPCSYTSFEGKRLKIYRSRISADHVDSDPGTIIGFNQDSLNVSTSDGVLCIMDLQLEGKRKMTAKEFNRGNSIAKGTVLGAN